MTPTPKMGFSERLSKAAEFELRLIEKLNNQGWPAYAFGQSQLPSECRSRLTRFQDSSRRPSLIRWMPDIITFYDRPRGSSFVALIDAKVCGDKTNNYAIEISAIETCSIYTDKLFTPTFFVFDDWNVLTPREAYQRGRPGPESPQGSGTPYVLVRKCYSRPFGDVFPPRPDSAG